MSSSTSDAVDLLGYKLCDLMSELYVVHTGELFIHDETGEPWSSDMSGPFKYAVWNNDSFAISEVSNPQLAKAIAGGRDSVDAGENIKLYVNDVTTRKKLSGWGISPEIYRSYIKTCMCASSWIVESCAYYILRTADTEGGYDSIQHAEQKLAMMDVFVSLAKLEELSFCPGSNKDDHRAMAIGTRNKEEDDLANQLFLRVIDNYRKKREALMNAINGDDGDEGYRAELDFKGQAAKQRRNQKKYAKKKVKKQKVTLVSFVGEQDVTQILEVEVKRQLNGGGFDGVDEAHLDTCRDLWRKIMTESSTDTSIEGTEDREGLESEGVHVRDFALEAHDPQELRRPGILDAKIPVSWEEANFEFQASMARCGLQCIPFIKDKLDSGESRHGDCLEIFYREAVPVNIDPNHE